MSDINSGGCSGGPIWSNTTVPAGTLVGRAAGGDVAALTAAQARAVVHGPAPVYLDAYNDFFGATKVWVTGQATTGTTLTADVSAGATVLPVASASGLSAGVALVTGAGTVAQQLLVVQSVDTLNVTVSPATAGALSTGAAVTPLWTNESHLTITGLTAFAYWVANHASLSGMQGKVTVLGNSWISQLASLWATAITSAHPSTTVVEAGHGGDGPTQLIARFAADVPVDSDYVIINEPGVNACYGSATGATLAENLESLVGLIRGIGAVPVIIGHVPLSAYVSRSGRLAAEQKGLVGDGMMFPAPAGSGAYALIPPYVAPNLTSLGLGTLAAPSVTGTANTGVGYRALQLVTSGINNTAVGQSAGQQCVTGANNTAVGAGALTLNTAGASTAVGSNALVLATSGGSNTAVGADAGYNVAGSTSDATTTASNQTFVGYRSGGGAAISYVTAVGASAKASGTGALALGAGTAATASGAGAIGRDSAGTGASSSTQDEIGLGTALHTVRLAGYLRIDRSQTTVGAAGGASALPATPTKYLSVKDSAGTEYVFPVYAKA